ncbi:MAG: hypothetical protein J6R17_05415 [Bacteroidales bacterium]|nr:hypothetical protein [Bacteroidales bacterium]
MKKLHHYITPTTCSLVVLLTCSLFLYGVPAIAVGLSAISFSAFASASVSSFRLQKDAAPIPNALEAANSLDASMCVNFMETLKRLYFIPNS